MKTIINGKMYDTEKAERIATWDNGIYGNDFRSCSEELYKTKKGNYFLHGEGGAMSEYAEAHGNSKSGGEEIMVLEPEQAFVWCCDHKNADIAETEFPGMIEEA